MPELPDVEGFRRVLRQAVGKRIDEVVVRDSGVLRGHTAEEFARTLRGRRVASTRRHGKYLIAVLAQPGERQRSSDPRLVLHFGMTGALHWSSKDAHTRHRHDRVLMTTATGELRYRDMRKLKGLHLVQNAAEMARMLADVGPDAASISREEFAQRLDRCDRQLKAALLGQTVLAGLGNLLADEIIWRARVHPSRRTSELTAADQARLHRRMATVLRHAVRVRRVPDRVSWLTGQRNVAGGSCPRCATTLRHSRVASRRTVWCPRCQPV